MPITVPEIGNFTDAQWEIHDLPFGGRYMITGGPGSGKTTIAIRRIEDIKKSHPKLRIKTLLFTRTLNDFFKSGIESVKNNKFDADVTVWASWQRKLLIKHGAWPYGENDKVPWDTLSDEILNFNLNTMYEHLIIDEAQDYSKSDLQVMNLIAENITVFADPNQQINGRGVSDIDLIKSLLNIDDADCTHLDENHRNSKQIIKAAKSLAPDEIDFNLDEIKRKGQKPKVIHSASFDNEIEYICKIMSANPQSDIGILHLENNVLYKIFDKLDQKGIEVELLRKNPFDWNSRKPKLCTLNSAKGLEFDIVIMPQLNKDNYYEHPTNLKRIYVGMTRARRELHLCYFGSYPTIYIPQMDRDTLNFVG